MHYSYEESLKFNNIFVYVDTCYYCEKLTNTALFLEDFDGSYYCEDCTIFMDMSNFTFVYERSSQADDDKYRCRWPN